VKWEAMGAKFADSGSGACVFAFSLTDYTTTSGLLVEALVVG